VWCESGLQPSVNATARLSCEINSRIPDPFAPLLKILPRLVYPSSAATALGSTVQEDHLLFRSPLEKKNFLNLGIKKKFGSSNMGPRKFRALFVASYKLFFSLSEAIRLDMALKVFIPDKTSRPSTLPMVVRTAQSLQVLTTRSVLNLCRVLLVTIRVAPTVFT
jgi:hypothetical protein